MLPNMHNLRFRQSAAQRSYDTQGIISALVRLALEPIPLEQQLERTLDLLFSVPWLTIKAKGSIFLVENDPNVLVLKAQRNLAAPLLTACAQVAFGHCLCGRAAASASIVHAGCIDHRHETHYDGMIPHGHVCVPIKYEGKVLGVINLYLEEHYDISRDEAEFLTTIADTLASAIGRRRAEEALRRNEKRFLELVEATSGWEWKTDENGVYSYISPFIRDVLAYDPQEVIGQRPFDLMPKEEAARVAEIFQGLIARRERFVRLENIRRCKDGRLAIIETSGVPVYDEEGRFCGYHGIDHDITERRRSEQKVHRLLESAPDAVVISDRQGKIELINRKTEVLFGYERDELAGQNIQLLLSEETRRLLPGGTVDNAGWPSCLAPEADCERHGRRKDGSVFPIEFSLSPLETEQDTLVIALVRDISERRVIERERARLASFPEHSPNPIIEIDRLERITYVNPVARATFPDLLELGTAHPMLEGVDSSIDAMHRSGQLTETREVEVRDRNYSQTISRIPATGITRIYAWDITSTYKLAQALEYQARHDALTGLINRSEFELRLRRSLARAVNASRRHALLYIDLDQFKVVNDTCGHAAGDELLKQLSGLLHSRVRGNDTLARLGGDEFGLLLENCSLDAAQQIAENIKETVTQFRFGWDGKTFRVGASIGLVPVTASSGNVTNLLSSADSACYVAKEQGRNRVHTYQPDDAALAQHRSQMEWTLRIRQALEQDQFRLYYQKFLPLAPDLPPCECREILVRMADESGLIPPMAFIPAAERYGLMQPIDRWVVQNTLRALRGDDLAGVAMLSINISAQSLCDNQFLEFVIAQLSESGLSPKKICFEITETAAIANFTSALLFITTLKGMGCRFALDDFGVGLSSLAYLRDLPVDFLKIHGGFVKDIMTDPISYAMVVAVREIGRAMGARTVGECVENQATLDKLREIGVDYAQGYAVAEPCALGSLGRAT